MCDITPYLFGIEHLAEANLGGLLWLRASASHMGRHDSGNSSLYGGRHMRHLIAVVTDIRNIPLGLLFGVLGPQLLGLFKGL